MEEKGEDEVAGDGASVIATPGPQPEPNTADKAFLKDDAEGTSSPGTGTDDIDDFVPSSGEDGTDADDEEEEDQDQDARDKDQAKLAAEAKEAQERADRAMAERIKREQQEAAQRQAQAAYAKAYDAAMNLDEVCESDYDKPEYTPKEKIKKKQKNAEEKTKAKGKA